MPLLLVLVLLLLSVLLYVVIPLIAGILTRHLLVKKGQAYPVDGSPYGVAGSPTLVWVSTTADNTVIGYDLSTGIPVEKVRYPTVQQPDVLAFDAPNNTLYVVSGSGAGVQVIRDAGVAR